MYMHDPVTMHMAWDPDGLQASELSFLWSDTRKGIYLKNGLSLPYSQIKEGTIIDMANLIM